MQRENELLDFSMPNSEIQKSTSFIPRIILAKRLARSKEARARFVESHLKKSIAFQIRSLRNREHWTQTEFADHLGMRRQRKGHQTNVSGRLENSRYGKHSLTTLRKIAAAFDVALVVWFIPFSRLIDWATETPYTDEGLTEEFFDVPAFDEDPGIKALEKKEAEEDRLVEELKQPWMQNTMATLEHLGDQPSGQKENVVRISEEPEKIDNIAAQTEKKPSESVTASAKYGTGGR